GGMGAVYRVHDQQLGEDVALKLVTLDSLEAKERFRREVKLARRITHPNVARTHDIGEHEGRWFLTMELIGGGTLEDRLAEGPLPLPEAASIGRSLALGLAAAHDVAVVHRDLKPGNVMLEPAGSGLRVVITDFGIARSLADEGPSKASRVVGTPLYMAPEQLLGETVTPASDVYALGLLLFEMLTGELPFEGSTPMASVVARCREAPRDPRTLAQVPDPIADLILACLQLEPERRPPLVLVAEMLEAWSLTALAKTRMGTLPAEYASFLRTGFDTQTPVSSQRISTPFAPISIGERRLAVLPFRYRGPSDHDYLGESLTQELIDVLSRTRGLKVLAFGASETEQRERNPRAAGERLGVQTVVDGDVLAAGPKVRVSVRMLDVQSGVQLWTDRFEGELEDIFRMQDIVSQRISEALRVELDAGNVSYHASAETSQDYLRARRDLHSWRFSSAMALLERCLERDP
ncbi:MAG: protein kinase, partial [Myxococcales bacterium]|nr:protein kinase [Myxococcales bacterium]